MQRSIRLATTFLLITLLALAHDGHSRSADASGTSTAQDDPPARQDIKLKRRQERSAEDLRKQLLRARELGLGQPTAAMLYAPIKKALENDAKALPAQLGPFFLNQAAARVRRPDLVILPWRGGDDCQIGKEAAERLQVLSVELRRLLRASVPSGDVRPDVTKLRKYLREGDGSGSGIKPAEWRTPEALPTLTQMLQAEGTPVRLLLVELLTVVPGRQASEALARRALFDLAPEVRERAIAALAQRPQKEFRRLLLEGLNWPWSAAADHAAETLVALKMKDTVPELITALKLPDEKTSRWRMVSDLIMVIPTGDQEKGKPTHLIREVVRVNHLANCMVCHAPSMSKEDLVRGRVPAPGEDPPPQYYQEATGLFVRADITFLRQEFSVVQPVPASGKWPGNQRYDYLLRTRPATPQDLKLLKLLERNKQLPEPHPQHQAVLFALRELTQSNMGNTYADWAPLLRGVEVRPDPFERRGPDTDPNTLKKGIEVKGKKRG